MAVGNKINLERLSFVIYKHVDLKTFRRFAIDFGLTEITEQSNDQMVYFRGYGLDPYVYVAQQAEAGEDKSFVGAGFCARSEQDFQAASRIEGAQVVDQTSAPGGGKMALLRDPNGYEMRVLWGQEEQKTPEHGVSVLTSGKAVNGALDKRRKGTYTRMISSAAMIHKLGHYGYETDNYEATVAWYTGNFNIRPTDLLHLPGNKDMEVAGFFRVDLGENYSDHHCLLIARGQKPGTRVHHSSFEVEDLDTQFMGHQWLLDRGYELVWGIGRHVHGSQVFDYWYDTSSFIVEHYADGDLVNEKTELLRAEAGNMAVWGPPVPQIWGGKVPVSA